MAFLTIDGIEYDVKCKIVREAHVKSSDISGEMLDKTFFNDVLGTYMQYDVEFEYPLYNQGKYAKLYQVLTEPIDGHVFILPYNQGTIQLTARVEVVRDEYEEMESGRKYWGIPAFSIIANHPTRTITLNQMITRGITAAPAEAVADDGDAYVYNGTTNDWDLLTDADDTAY